MKRQFKVFDFDVDYEYRPDTDRYQEILPDDLTITVEIPDNFELLTFDEQKIVLKEVVIEALEETVMFDTYDAPDFGISDVDFVFEIDSD